MLLAKGIKMSPDKYRRIINLVSAVMRELNDEHLTLGQYEEILDFWDATRDKMLRSYFTKDTQIKQLTGQRNDR